MKRYLLFLMALVLVVAVGCDQQKNPTTPESSVNPNPAAKFGVDQKIDLATIKAKMEVVKAKVAPLIAAHKAKPVKKRAQNETGVMGIEATLVVPDAFATIQDAVDAALPGDKITVKASGSPYAEFVIVSTPDIRIVASGAVTVLGSFSIGTGADGVSIEKFTIDASVFGFGILASENSGGKIKNNTVNGVFVALFGIILDGCTNYTVEDNVCNRSFIGILVGPFIFVGSPSNSNLIKENNCWENLAGIAVFFSNGNQFIENTCSWNTEIGIGAFESNNNEFQENVCNNNGGPGFVVTGISSGNIIRPDNSAKKNKDHGIILDVDTFDNKVKENTFTMNTPCDVLDDGTGNVIKNNTTDCIAP